MFQDKIGESQGFEAPELDLAAHAPELYQQVSNGIQVSLEMFKRNSNLMLGPK